VRQVFLGKMEVPSGLPSGLAGMGASPIGVTIFGHTMGVLDDALLVAAIGAVLLVLAIFAFSRQE